MSPIRSGAVLLGFGLLVSCGSQHVQIRQEGATGRLEGPLAVAPSVRLNEVPGAVENDPFVDGVHVGHLHMSGGYVILETERGMQHRSKEVTPSAEESYAAEASRWLDRTVAEIVSERGVEGRPISPIPPSALAPPGRRIRRGSEGDDLRDNQNLPRFELDPGPLEVSALEGLPEGTRFVLVPILVHYYSHNGGWFIGQTYGTGGGARIRVLWVVYDAETGQPHSWGEVAARKLDGRRYSPSRAEIEDYLLEVESRATRGLERHLLR
jgi:hypothetical protein